MEALTDDACACIIRVDGFNKASVTRCIDRTLRVGSRLVNLKSIDRSFDWIDERVRASVRPGVSESVVGQARSRVVCYRRSVCIAEADAEIAERHTKQSKP